jgi:hypothetical protein
VVAPTQEQAKILFRRTKEILYDVGASFISDQQTGLELSNRSQIKALAAVERTTRGHSPDLLIVDEAAAVPDETYYAALLPSLLATGGDQILLSTPRGKRGYFYDIWEKERDKWFWKKVTSPEAPHVKPEMLETLLHILPDFLIPQELYCEFNDTETQIYPTDVVMAAVGDDIPILDIGELQ